MHLCSTDPNLIPDQLRLGRDRGRRRWRRQRCGDTTVDVQCGVDSVDDHDEHDGEPSGVRVGMSARVVVEKFCRIKITLQS